MIVLRTETSAPIRWQCSVCGDEGVISDWEDSAFDLRRRQLTLAEAASEIAIPNEVAAALRGLHCWTPTANDWCSGSAPAMTTPSSQPPTTTWTTYSGSSQPMPTVSPANPRARHTRLEYETVAPWRWHDPRARGPP